MQMLKGCEKILRGQEMTNGAVGPGLRAWSWFYRPGDNSGPQCPCLYNDDAGFKDPNIKEGSCPHVKILL